MDVPPPTEPSKRQESGSEAARFGPPRPARPAPRGRLLGGAQSPTPRAQEPSAAGPQLERPQLERPQLERPQLERPQLERPQLEGPQLEGPELEGPELEVVGGARGERALPLRVWAWLRDDASDWCRGKSWEVRVPVMLLFVYVLFRSVVEEEYTNFFFGGINLGFHEAGHALFGPFGEFMMIAGGTILQCLVPLLAAFALWRTQRDYFGVAFSLAWFGTNAFGCAIYASDARGQRNLPLVSPWGQSFGRDGNGDWTRMLSKLDMLKWDTTIAFWFNCAGVLAFVLAIALGAWLLWRMHASRSEPPPPPPAWAT